MAYSSGGFLSGLCACYWSIGTVSTVSSCRPFGAPCGPASGAFEEMERRRRFHQDLVDPSRQLSH